VRLAVRRQPGNAYTPSKNRPVPKSRKNEGPVARMNRKITSHIHRKIEIQAIQRCNELGSALPLPKETSGKTDKKLNMPALTPGDKYIHKIRSLAGRNRRKGGSVGKSKRR